MSAKLNVVSGNSRNPNVPDMPLGLGMALAGSFQARSCFEALNDENKTKVIKYIQASISGNDAKRRINNTIENLSNNNISFI